MKTLVGLALATMTLGGVAAGCGGAVVYDAPRVRAATVAQPCPAPIRGNGIRARLPSGVYRCNIYVIGDGNSLVGSHRTVIRGNLIVRGNGNRINRLRVRGTTRVAGLGNVVNRRAVRGRRVVVQSRPHWYYRY